MEPTKGRDLKKALLFPTRRVGRTPSSNLNVCALLLGDSRRNHPSLKFMYN